MKLAIAVLGIVLATGSGCGRSKDKLEKQKAEARKAGEKAAADVLKAYVDSMVSTMGKYALAESEGEFAPMEEWRKRAAATRIQELAEEKASKFGDSPLRRSLRQGTAVFTVIRDYHIGRPIAGEETIVKAGEPKDEKWSGEGRIVLEKDDYFEQLEAFRGSEAAKPWIPALDFERLLPWVMELYAFRGKGGVDTRRYLMHLDNASRFVRGLWSGSDGQYVAYRDKLCKDGVKAACRIPYEHRHLVVAGQYVDFARDKIGEFRKTHPNSDFEPLLARFESDLDLEKKNIAVPEEYPPLPLSLLGWVPSPRPRATLTMGRKGASFVMRTDEGADTRPLTDARKGWALSAAERTALEARFRDAGERLYASTEAHHGGPRIQVLAEGSVTADVLVGSLTRAALKAKVNSLVLVGRDDKLLQRRGFAVTVLSADDRTEQKLEGPGGTWTCTPSWSTGFADEEVAAVYFAEGDTLTLRTVPEPEVELSPIGADAEGEDKKAKDEKRALKDKKAKDEKGEAGDETAPKVAPPAYKEATGSFGAKPELAAIKKLQSTFWGPTVIALKPSMDYAALHRLVNAIGTEADDSSAIRTDLRFSLCEEKVVPPPPPAPTPAPEPAPGK